MVITVIVNNKDISSDFKKYFTNLQIIDRDGVESDELSFTITYTIKRPSYEDKIKIWIDGFFYGLFVVQSTETDHMDRLKVRATGTNFLSSIKTKKSRSFSDTTLNKLITTIAKENGLNFKVDFSNVNISNLIQEKESDLHFLTRLAKDHDAIFSVKNSTLIFLERSMNLPTFSIDLGSCSIWTVSHTNKKLYSSCKLSYRSTKENTIKSVTVGSGTPILAEEESCQDDQEATSKAKAKLQRANRGTKEGYFLMKGTYVSAGSTINIIGSKQDDGEYTAEVVTTSIDSISGWTVEVDFKN